MTADKPSHLVPKLRFPEFRDEPEWNGLLLEELEAQGRIKLGRGKVISHADMRASPGPYPVYSSSVIDEGLMGTYGDYLFDEELISWSVDGGGNFFYRPKHRFSVTNVSGFMRVLCDDIVCQFLAYQMQRLHVLQTFDYQQKAHPSVIRTLYVVGLPELVEQKKIADCLGSLDDMIAAEGRKHDALRQHKQGLMQQLFPQPGETVPRLRFPEFADAPHWQTSTFGERCESFNGGTPNTSKGAYYGGTIPFIRSAEIGRNETELFLTEEGLENSVAKMVKRGDLLVALYGANSGDTALARVNGAINQAIMCLRSRDSVPFLYHYLTARKNWIIATYLQGGQGNLSRQIVLSVSLSVPCRDEQKKVADCLSTLDARIEGQAQRIDVLLRHKRGLLQQLFPSLQGHWV